MREPSSCFRCGDFGPPFAPGIPVCAPCLAGERTAPDASLWHSPPPSVTWRHRWPLIPLLVFGSLAGAVVSLRVTWTGGGLLSDALMGGLLGAVLATFVAVFVLYRWLVHWGMSGWRREVKQSLGLGHVPDESVSLVLHVFSRWKPLNMKIPAEYGLLVEVEGGLVFFGIQGTRSAFPLERVAAVSAPLRWLIFPPQTALCLGLRDGTRCFFRVKDGPNWAANRARTLALAERLEVRRAERAADAR